ncbi:hypothetical protein ABZ883_19885 [Streptomyces sp. NPDC046977]|uniref:hypothetical protein n=1 Tax=Streptomyces sp. NPDC046977 TaxID=3154703 RepID=UPI0033CB0F34
MTVPERPRPITSCWLSWLAVPTWDREAVADQIGLTGVTETTWSAGVELIDRIAHDLAERLSHVLVTPALNGWVLVVGPWCGLPDLNRTADVTRLCLELSTRHHQAHAYFYGERGDGDAWLIAENGSITRRWISEYPELALGRPVEAERRSLDAIGVVGRPEDFDPEEAVDVLADWECPALAIAQALSLNPTALAATSGPAGTLLVATPPAARLTDPFAHSGTLPG